eukprot:gene1599-12724_t
MLYSQLWYWDTSLIIPKKEDDKIPIELKLIYSFQFSFYFHLLISLLFFDKRLSDFHQMLIHHMTSLLLITFSSLSLLSMKIGIIVFYIHDIVDILLYTTKCLNDSNFKRTSTISFFIFSLVYFYLRLYYFGVHVIWKTIK